MSAWLRVQLELTLTLRAFAPLAIHRVLLALEEHPNTARVVRPECTLNESLKLRDSEAVVFHAKESIGITEIALCV